MLRTTRRSVARDAAEWEAEDVTAILNEEAANLTRSSPRKRKRESRGGSSATSPSNKRIQLGQPTPSTSNLPMSTTASPSRRKSGRLQARKSLSAPKHVNRPDLYEIPDDPEPKAGTNPLLKPIKKFRPLNVRPQQTASPFKGKGVLETRTNALVNLDDSPRKRPVRNRIEKIGRSLHKARRPASKLKETSAMVDQLPFDGSDADAELGRNPQSPAIYSNPLPEVAKQTLAKETSKPVIVDEAVEEGREKEADNAAYEEGRAPVELPPERSQRPRTRAERDAAEQSAAEAEAKREQMVKDTLSGIEVAVQIRECKDAWTDSLVAAAEIAENRTSSGAESIKGKACAREFKKMAHIYKKLHRGNSGSPRRLEYEKRETLGLLKRRCKHICDYHYKPDMPYDLERKRMVRDLYEHLIPSSLDLAKRALKTLFQNDEFSMAALREICQLLNITSRLVNNAQAWRPRPELGNAVKSKTHSDIKPNVETIVEKYRRAIDEDERERFVDELEVRQKQNLERQQAEYQRRREAVRAKHRQYRCHAYHDGAPLPDQPVPGSQRPLVDIDDISIDDERAWAEPGRREGTGHANGAAAPIRPGLRREPTEDIPPPDETEWSQNELIVLVNALQEFTSESRWEDIIDAYGGPCGRLERYDMDQIMAKARWVKQTMARQLEDELDESWDWLRSVPG
ncbi:hypothetical protein CLAIMM_08308 [Cladophialophora immunda]|nr:hypothetical protein CLAIMM_08308 [Cladophialophora immunda]